ncbi:RNA polymerase factor sigma-54 [Alkaliphilus hydrothermalis]|uniref:RNA polymerase sigma-54 factor n=1 Tax=Alkaliphilus hydrothermalis TaxID=1482730 RepID=A0ABS2NP57_9FIRM|nr:RNA polymerase factor sigma-54 [Alkaliphilus hydrothermalis]MBM7614364.1 RNA polymerase sigma-54 factor [Alkaliphilus hydrothermalis]
MRMGYNLQLEQTQKLVMTPQLQQAIKILQLNAIELDRFIQKEMETNPLLEINESYETEYEKDLNESTKNKLKEKEIDWKEFSDDYHSRGIQQSGGSYSGDNEMSYENMISVKPSLQDFLMNQYHLTLLNKNFNEVGEYIIYSLDENGYLNIPLMEIAEEFNIEPSVVENILTVIQTFEPAGIAARNLKECLIIQLKQLGVMKENAYQLIEEYLVEIADNKYPQVAKKMGITVEEVQNICDFIRTLEPKPGRKFSSANHTYIVPDVVVKKIGEDYVVIINDRIGPRLMIRDDYRKMLSNNDENSDTVKFINDKLNSASWLIRSIEQRRQTIYKVVEKIIEKQRDFFDHGKKYLKPMTLKEIAEEIEVHESTVSRATNGKYVETPSGTFELKYFFTSGIEGEDGEGVSAESIKSIIKEIINEENPKKPLSDSKIADILTEKGMPISRRTVAKYRDDLLIPASSKRKRF